VLDVMVLVMEQGVQVEQRLHSFLLTFDVRSTYLPTDPWARSRYIQ
jgi:hypothetical protein